MGGETGVPGENLSVQSREPTTWTQPTYDAGSGNRTQATSVEGECSRHCAIPAAPPLLWTSSMKILFTLEQHRKMFSWTATVVRSPVVDERENELSVIDKLKISQSE